MPIMSSALKIWLQETDTSIDEIRAAQTSLDNEVLHLDENLSFMLFAREVTLWDLAKNIEVRGRKTQMTFTKACLV